MGIAESGGKVPPEACGTPSETVGMTSGRPVAACNQASCSSENGGAGAGTTTGSIGSQQYNRSKYFCEAVLPRTALASCCERD